jgi:hypothetical protein
MSASLIFRFTKYAQVIEGNGAGRQTKRELQIAPRLAPARVTCDIT